jgi:ABC-2 type transport system permease protein
MNIIGIQTLIIQEFQRFTRVWVQSLVSPWMSALLYIFIFGSVVGSRIDLIVGVEYIDFVLPGIVMMNLITSSYMQGAFSIYFKRFQRQIEEILVAPFSNIEMLVAFVIGGVVRGLIVGLGVYIIALLFTTASMNHFFLFITYSIAVTLIFSLVGILIGLWAENFEQLNVLSTFVIMPLTFLGGVFNSITMLPPAFQTFVKLNPFFYFVDSLRYAMIGIREGSAFGANLLMLGLIVGLGGLTWHLFQRGWKIRN